MFTLEELEGDPSLFLDLKEDVREEYAILGDVMNVVLYGVREPPLPAAQLVTHRSIRSFVSARTEGHHDGQVLFN